MLALPYFLLALTLVAAMGTGYRNSVIAISIWMIPHFTRVVRGQVLSLRETEFVQAAHAIGETRGGAYSFATSCQTACPQSSYKQRSTCPARSCWAPPWVSWDCHFNLPIPEWGVLIAELARVHGHRAACSDLSCGHAADGFVGFQPARRFTSGHLRPAVCRIWSDERRSFSVSKICGCSFSPNEAWFTLSTGSISGCAMERWLGSSARRVAASP